MSVIYLNEDDVQNLTHYLWLIVVDGEREDNEMNCVDSIVARKIIKKIERSIVIGDTRCPMTIDALTGENNETIPNLE